MKRRLNLNRLPPPSDSNVSLSSCFANRTREDILRSLEEVILAYIRSANFTVLGRPGLIGNTSILI